MKRLLTILTIISFLLTASASMNVLRAADGHSLWFYTAYPQYGIGYGTDDSVLPKTMQEVIDKEYDALQNSGDPLLKDAKLNLWRVFSEMITLGEEGYDIYNNNGTIQIEAATEKGLLYGIFAAGRLSATGKLPKKGESIIDKPICPLRILNHWDNLNGTIERGFAGRSIFWGKPIDDKTILEYARANASVGINGTVLNNVNSSPQMLSDENIKKAAHVAKILRPYGIKVYLSVNFASPKVLGGLPTADPLDPDVREWWKAKVKDIYEAIPDFGGFLVKANSEGQPGPGDYKRTHAQGANMLAEALDPYDGIVMWRAFVYAADSPDRANQAYDEFMPLDGQFRDNVIVQIKNGPIDFQPREPVSPLFFGLKKTKMMPEFQVTQEYTGESIHTCHLASMWREFFDDIQYGGAFIKYPAIAGVANIGDSPTWCGSDMTQVNWYAFGRMAWNPTLSPKQIAEEWLMQTFSTDRGFVKPMTKVLCESREAVVNYMMPIGLHHIFAGNHHYGPEPWYAPRGVRSDWTPPYYHKAAADGMGFDRTATGSDNLAQYPEPIRTKYATAEQYLVYFHHAPWSEVWPLLCSHYDKGVKQAEGFARTWAEMERYVDAERFAAQKRKFDRQAMDAWWWRDACLLYFQTFSNMPFPKGSPAPRFRLDDLQHYTLRMDNYTAADIDRLPVPRQ